MQTDLIIAGGGPAGLSAALTAANLRCSVLVLEQNHDIGTPIRTSGGSFIDELDALGIPPHLYHAIGRGRFLSPTKSAIFDYPVPKFCVMDVRGVYQFLAERAIEAGAAIRLATAATEVIQENGFVTGVRTRSESLSAKLVIDATGHRSVLLKNAGLDPGFQRFGVGAEYDLYAPYCDENEAVLLVGDRVAPSGYAWVFPWGRHRVRVGVGIIHPDSRQDPHPFLDRLVSEADRYGVNLKGGQPVEYHHGLIPSERFADRFVGDGILAVGDAAGHASSLLGEGIRWAIEAGRMAGQVAAKAIHNGDVSRAALEPFEKRWLKRHGRDLKLAHKINQRIARWDDQKWDDRMDLIQRLTPDQFLEALKTNLTGGWLLRFLTSNAGALADAAGIL
jgi:digeranylgeranylglycerophospholipid reductase